jgi:hypothetical protein
MIEWALFALFVVGGPSVSGQAADAMLDALRREDPGWVSGYESDVVRQMRLLSAAYELDMDMQAALAAEMEARLIAQKEFEVREIEKLNEVVDQLTGLPNADDSPLAAEAIRLLTKMGEEMPMNEALVANWLEERLPVEVAQRGRPRLEELWHRQARRQLAQDQDLERRAARKGDILRARKARQAVLSPDAKPIPPGHKAEPVLERARQQESKRFVRPGQTLDRQIEKPRREAKPKIVTAPPKQPDKPGRQPTDFLKPQPLDEWDKLVASVAERYKFTDAQVTKARSILRDLRRRAYQYQVSRSVEFAKAESIVNKKARGERLQTLKAPLHAMFAELGQRLESLATVEQRQQAPTPKKGRK